MAYSKVPVQDLEGEVWMLIDFIDDLTPAYFVSNKGRLKTKNRPDHLPGVKRYGHLLRTPISNTGYVQVFFSDRCKLKPFTVHRLVAMAFLPNPENKGTVNHKDSNRLNNCVENLEWNTQQENIQHRWRVNPINSARGVNNGRAKFTETDVLKVRELCATGIYKQGEIAKLFNTHATAIHNIYKRKTYKDIA